MRKNRIDVCFIADRYNTRYLSGFSGTSSYILISSKRAYFYTDARYFERVEKDLNGIYHTKLLGKTPWRKIEDCINNLSCKIIGFEETIPYVIFKRLRTIARDERRMKECGHLIRNLRMIKDEYEIESIQKAAALTDEIFSRILDFIKPGRREIDIARRIKKISLSLGIDAMAFPPIVASGPNAAVPHHEPGARTLESGDVLILDFGATFNGYCADMTRTIFIGKPHPRMRKIYRIVHQAQQIGLQSLRVGIRARSVDRKVRQFINHMGYAKQFIHGLGHSLGLEIHESPALSQVAEGYVRAGMLFTIEPGIYVSGEGGVRIEDTVLVEPTGIQILSGSDKDLIVV